MLNPTFLNCAAFAAALVCLLPPATYAGQDSTKRKEIVTNHLKLLELALEEVWGAETLKAEHVETIKRIYPTTVKEMFSDLKKNDLIDEKMTSYQEYWKKLEDSPLFTRPASPKALAALLTSFSKNVTLAAAGDRCTVSVSASKGNGAVVKYVKAVDAADGSLKELGISTTQAELEKAEYVFVTFRSGKETGRTSKKDCTGSKQIVEIPEN